MTATTEAAADSGGSVVREASDAPAFLQDDSEFRCWSADVSQVAAKLDTDLDQGLSAAEVETRLRRYGRNILTVRPPVRWLTILFRQFKSVIVVLLLVAFLVAVAFSESLEAVAIAAVVLINAAIGFVTELRAERSMEALTKLGSRSARVVRSGTTLTVDAENLVPGDLLLIGAGDVVAADARIISSSRLESDEAVLTGESLPVSKDSHPVRRNGLLHERTSMLFKGTSVSRGSARCIVTATGQQTELGKIAELSRHAEPEATPLERRLNRLGHRLVALTLVVGVAVLIAGIASDRGLYIMVQTAVALAVATIPEGLPIVATIALAAGIRRMARRNVLVNRLSSVETLGSTHVIFTDKTGTLTENRMEVAEIATSAGRVHAADVQVAGGGTVEAVHDPVAALVSVAALCNDAVSGEEGDGAEPMERAILQWLDRIGISARLIRERNPRIAVEAFDPEVKMMATIHGAASGAVIAVKGAPEAVLRSCDTVWDERGTSPLREVQRRKWLELARDIGASGQRVLAFARKTADHPTVYNPYSDLEFVGLVGMNDPPRQEVRQALADCALAGIDVVMVTGDQPGTALSVAHSVGLIDGADRVMLGSDLTRIATDADAASGDVLESRIFARVSPSQKLDLITFFQRAGHTVAMTGDGVNDAPALKKADIGVAMGVRGTEVAKEAADIVLLDDAFSSIVAAVRQGRIIFDNIRTFVVYLMSCNLSEVLIVSLSVIAGGPLAILPLQILFLNLVTDVFPALALGVSRGRGDVLDDPPRAPDTPILRRQEWLLIGGLGAVMTVAVLGSLFFEIRLLDQQPGKAVTVSFLTLVTSQLVNVFNMRSASSGVAFNEVTRNRYVWLALLLCVGITLVVLEVPAIARTMSLSDPGLVGWLVVGAGCAFTFLAGQFALFLINRLDSDRSTTEVAS